VTTGHPAPPPVLSVHDLEVRYGLTIAASGVALQVGRGEAVALLGPNGAGKTSVLRAIMGLVPPAAGRIEFFDGASTHRVEGRSAHLLARLGIANVPAQHVVLPRMTVAENLEVGALFLVRDRDRVQRTMAEMFAKFPILAARRRQYAGSLSGGEQRQLALARALMARPRLMLLDEPSLGLAPRALGEVFELLRRINREEGIALLVVEQNVTKALELADRVYVMRIGAIDFAGPSAEVARSDRLRDAYLGA
jgi:branched-chain amino acid transport system ATP-binding protein